MRMGCRGDGDDDGGRGGIYLLFLRVGLVRIGPRNPVSAGVTLRMRTSSSSSSGMGSGRSTTLRWGEGVAARLLPGCRSMERDRER
jgi:hypothetical protein